MIRRTLLLLLLLTLVGPADAALAGTVRGTVTAKNTGAPVGNYRVDLFDTAVNRKTTATCTAGDGTYAFTNLAAGTYKVHFAGGPGNGCAPSTLAPQWYANRFSFQFAEPIAVAAAGEVADVNAALPDGATILGKVTELATGSAVANVRVKVLDITGETLREGCSAANGTYQIDGLVPGALLVGFFPDGTCGAIAGDFRTQYYKDADVINAALSVNASEGTVSPDVDARLKPVPVVVTRRLTLSVTGQAAVGATPGGIGCTDTCGGDYADGTTVTVTATPAPAMRFTGWQGACTGTGACTVTLTDDRAVTATFGPIGDPTPTPTATPTVTATPTATATATPTRPGSPTPAPGPGAGPRTNPAPSAAVSVSALKLSRTGTLSLRVSEPTTLSIKAERRVGKRWKAAKTVKHTAKRAGAAKVALKLRASGRYRVTVTPTARGIKGKAAGVTAQVRVKPRAARAAIAAADPVCQPRTYTTRPGVAVAVDINCVDAGVAPTVAITRTPIGGTLPALPGQYTPSPGFNGVDEVRYTVTNTATGLTSAETSINLVVNSLPTCSNGTATTEVDKPLKLVFPCTDPDGNAVLIRAEHGAHGTVDPTVGTQITYTPAPGYVGTDEVSFVGMDGAFQTAPRTLVITITPAPVVTATPTPTVTATPDASVTPQPTAAPTPAPPGGGADTAGPAVTVKASKPSVAKGVALTLTSDEPAIAKLTLTAGKHKVATAATLKRGTTTVTLKLSARARKALKAKRAVKSTLTVVATDAAGNAATTKVAVTLKR